MAMLVPRPETLHAAEDLRAVGCVDVRAGSVLAAWARDEGSREALELAAHAAAQLFLPARLDGEDGVPPREAVIVSRAAVHAFAACEAPGRVVVCIARGGASVALLLASARELKGAFGEGTP